MKTCKFCQAELTEESNAVCPQCGKRNDEQKEEASITQPLPEEMKKAIEAIDLNELDASRNSEAVEEIVDAPAQEEQEAQEPAEEAEQASAEEEDKEEEPEEQETASEETEAAPEKKATPGKIAAAVAAVVVLAAVLVALILAGMKNKAPTAPAQTETPAAEQVVAGTVPADGNPDDVTCKGSYTVSDEAAAAEKATVVAQIGDRVLTNGELQIYYWSTVNNYLSSEIGYTLMMYGMLDYTQPLDTTMSFEDNTLTWQQFFLQEALNYWQLSTSLAEEAAKAGYQISQADQEYLDGMAASLEATAASYGMDVDGLLRNNFGPGTDLDAFAAYQQLYAEGKDFYQAKLAEMVPTQEQLEQFFDEHAEGYAQSGITKDSLYVDVRHILIQVEGGEAATDEAWETCRQAAQAVLDQWMAGDKTEESFAALANSTSQDPGSNTNGGLYENVYKGQMVAPFEEWCFDASRQYGDTGLVQTSYGYHVMYYVGSEPMWLSTTESDWVQTQANLFIEGLASQHPMEVYYDKISLGYINMGA